MPPQSTAFYKKPPFRAEYDTRRLSDAELAALRLARTGLFVTSIASVTAVDEVGCTIPGWRVFQRLIKHDMVFITDNDSIDVTAPDGSIIIVDLTPMIEITEIGELMLKKHDII